MEQLFNDVKALVLGDKTIAFYIGAFFFSGLAIVASLYFSSTKRDKTSTNTPYKFSWFFLVWDNAKRVMIGMILMFFFYRFTPFTSMELAVAIGLFVSVGLDQAFAKLKERFNFLQMNRDKLPTKPI